MKRSKINQKIDEAILFFEEMKFKLPPWGYWSLCQWKEHKNYCMEIFTNGLGWDLTDFGSGDYNRSGLLLFTLRNVNLQEDRKTYAEKIMIVDEGQVTPMHFHWSKVEDIINRGGRKPDHPALSFR
jgi:D-lyxose ketol-isomerase